MDDVVIVGASAAGLAAAESLRREGYAGRLHVVGAEAHLPYDRPPLSKRVLSGEWTADRTMIRNSDALASLDANWILETSAQGLDPDSREVKLADGWALGYDGLVIATGVSPRRLPSGHELTGVHTLRTRDDADRLRAALLEGPRVVVVGAGFLGAEAAAVACQIGLEVTLVAPETAPMGQQLGVLVGSKLGELHADRGVRLHMGTSVAELVADRGRVVGVRLVDGSRLDADLVLVAIGSVPNTGWLQGSGLGLSDGVECDALCRAAPGVVAAGDVANWFHPGVGRRIRVEHRMNAAEQGHAAARTLLDLGSAFAPVPYAWSDQYDVTLRMYGVLTPTARAELVAGDPGAGRFAVAYRDDDSVVAALTWNMPREAIALRQQVAEVYDRRATGPSAQIAAAPGSR